MTLPAVKTFTAGDVLSYQDLNAINFNILHNPMKLISPLTGSLDAGSNDLTNLDELWFNDAGLGVNPTAAGRLRRDAAISATRQSVLAIWQPVASANVRLGGGLERDVVSADVVNTTTETTAWTFTLPGDTVVQDRRWRVIMIGTYLNNSGADSNLTVKLTLSITSAQLTFGPMTLSTGATRRGLYLQAEMSIDNTVTPTVNIHSGSCIVGALGTAAGTGAAAAFEQYGNEMAGAFNFAFDQIISIRFLHSVANANISAVATVVHMELIP